MTWLQRFLLSYIELRCSFQSVSLTSAQCGPLGPRSGRFQSRGGRGLLQPHLRHDSGGRGPHHRPDGSRDAAARGSGGCLDWGGVCDLQVEADFRHGLGPIWTYLPHQHHQPRAQLLMRNIEELFVAPHRLPDSISWGCLHQESFGARQKNHKFAHPAAQLLCALRLQPGHSFSPSVSNGAVWSFGDPWSHEGGRWRPRGPARPTSSCWPLALALHPCAPI